METDTHRQIEGEHVREELENWEEKIRISQDLLGCKY